MEGYANSGTAEPADALPTRRVAELATSSATLSGIEPRCWSLTS